MAVQDTASTTTRADKSGSAARAIKLGLAFLVTLMLASAWLVFPYFLEGRSVLRDAGSTVVSERNAQHRTLGQILTRVAMGPGESEVDALFATDVYFERTSSPRIANEYGVGTYHIFFVNEGVHTGELPQSLPQVTLIVDGIEHSPVDLDGPVATDHHRTTIVRFARIGADGRPVIPNNAATVSLVMTNQWDEENTARQVTWDWPVNYPDADSLLTSPALIMALSAGLLSATLTPCLLQLIVVYMATLTGLSAEQVGRKGAVPHDIRRKMMLSALAFIFGFVVFYTAAGALIGYAGKTAQIVFSEYSRQMATATGILVIAMGLWMGIKARAPIICRMPAPAMMTRGDGGGYIRSALLAAGFSLGCMVCFSGAIMATLFIYVGALGSASAGAMILFVFSMGVAIPFFLAALFLSRTMSVMHWAQRYSPQLGFVSMVVIIAFGIVLLTDNFHTVSDLIYPLLRLN